MEMDAEINNFVKAWIQAITSLCYCYYIAARIPRGIVRLFSLLPIFYLFITLPLHLSSFHLGGPTTFYLVWLANFKLLLFAFDNGPLFSNPQLSLFHFISTALLPIKPKHAPSPHIKKSDPSPKHPLGNKVFGPILLPVKILLLAAIVRLYGYRQYLHPNFILVLYCCHLYLGTELTLALSATPVRAFLGFELEPQFNEPYLATSLQDFWGHRWNLMVSSILRPTVYNPTLRVASYVVGSRWARHPAIFATFLVSGLMHEVIYFYLTRARPTWEVTWFFVLQGVCTAAEVAAKKAVAERWQLHRVVSRLLTVGFVTVTGVWLFLPQLIKNGVDLKAINEYSIIVSFLGRK